MENNFKTYSNQGYTYTKEYVLETIKMLMLKYINEFLEAFIALSIIKVVIVGKYDIKKVTLYSLLLAVITTILETYNKDYKDNIKNSFFASGISQIIKSF